MSKMAAMPVYGKKQHKNLLSNQWTDFHWKLGPIVVCSNDDPWLTLAYFAAKLNFVT